MEVKATRCPCGGAIVMMKNDRAVVFGCLSCDFVAFASKNNGEVTPLVIVAGGRNKLPADFVVLAKSMLKDGDER